MFLLSTKEDIPGYMVWNVEQTSSQQHREGKKALSCQQKKTIAEHSAEAIWMEVCWEIVI